MVESLQKHKPIVGGASVAIGAGAGFAVGKFAAKLKNKLPAEDIFVKDITETLQKKYDNRFIQAGELYQDLKSVPYIQPEKTFNFNMLELPKELSKELDIFCKKAINPADGLEREYLQNVLKKHADFYDLKPTKSHSIDEVVNAFIGDKEASKVAKELCGDIDLEFKLIPDFKAGAKEYYNYAKQEIKNVSRKMCRNYALIGASIAGVGAIAWALLSKGNKKSV